MKAPPLRRRVGMVAAAFLAAMPFAAARGQAILWDNGLPHPVNNNGVTQYLGYTSGKNSGTPQRWTASPITVAPGLGIHVTRVDLSYFTTAGAEPLNVKYALFQRIGLSAPGPIMLQGVLGPHTPGIDDPRTPDVDDRLHNFPCDITIAPGDYYITFYGDLPGAGNTTGYYYVNIYAGAEGVESLEQGFMWRSSSYPAPGFQPYNPAGIGPTPGQDPDDVLNLAFTLYGDVLQPPPDFTESGDAPETLPAQTTGVSGSLTSIGGRITDPNDGDLYSIRIDDPAAFSATTEGVTSFDTRLYLFDERGRPIAMSDNTTTSVQSRLTSQFVPRAGAYILGISASGRIPQNAAGLSLWSQQPPNVERCGDGPGATDPLHHWSGVGNTSGNYRINLSGCSRSKSCVPIEIVRMSLTSAVQVGGSMTMNVSASGGVAPLAYQWYGLGTAISGASGPVYTISGAQYGQSGKYYCEITDGCLTVRSEPRIVLVSDDACGEPRPGQGCIVPDAWKHDPVQTIMDQMTTTLNAGTNKIDDLIDVEHSANPALRWDVIVDFRNYIDGATTAWLEGLSAASSVQHSFCPGGITAVTMRNVSYAEILTITDSVDVALVEKQAALRVQSLNNLQAIRDKEPFHNPNTMQFRYPALQGAGAVVAVVDTGVDDGVNQFIPAAIASRDFTVSPAAMTTDDRNGHGTLMAGIILGSDQWSVAPRARLVDIKAVPDSGVTDPDTLLTAMQWIVNNRTLGGAAGMGAGIDVVLLPLISDRTSDGTDAISLMANRLVDSGMIVVAAAGNGGAVNRAPAVATGVIAVGAADDPLNTADRSDDTLASFSPTGPTAPTDLNQLKPEVIAPGTSIRGPLFDTTGGYTTGTGTSLAAAHVAGVAALYADRIHSWPGSFRALLRDYSYRGPNTPAPTAPALDSRWDNRWGWGLVDAFAIMDNAPFCVADVTFRIEPAYNFITGESNWRVQASRNITVTPDPPHYFQWAFLQASLRNFSSQFDATGVQIEWGVTTYSAHQENFEVLGRTPPFTVARTPTNPDGSSGVPPLVNSPPFAWFPTPVANNPHQCVQARIIYNKDCNQGNNVTRRNIAPTASPVNFFVQNLSSVGPTRIDFTADFEDGANGWGVEFSPPFVMDDGLGKPVLVTAHPLTPPGANDGDSKVINIQARSGDGCFRGYVIIRARVKDCNGNHRDDWDDIHDGISHDYNGDRIPDECQCVADVDDGSGTGTHDGGVTIDDLLYYLSLFAIGDIRADVDDGSNSGTHDGGVTIDDLLYYLFRFSQGC